VTDASGTSGTLGVLDSNIIASNYNVGLYADSIILSDSSINVGTGTLTLAPSSAAPEAITVGSDSGAGPFNVGPTLLSQINAGTVQIGTTANTGNTLTLNGNLSTSGMYNIALATGGNMVLGNYNINAGTHTIALNTSTGNITDGTGTLTGSSIALASTSGNIGTGVTNIMTVTSNLTANTTGNVYITNTGSVNFGASSGDALNLTSDGIVVDGNTSATTLNLTATGSNTITESTGTLTGTTVNLSSTSGTVGTSGNHLLTDAGTLTANTTGNDYITNTGSVTLGNSSAGSGDTFTLATTSNGNMTLGGTLAATSGTIGTINLTANGSGTFIESNGAVTALTVNLTSGTGDIGSNSSNFSTVTGNLTANTAGNVYVSNTGNVTVGTSSVGNNDTFSLATSSNGSITLAATNITATSGTVGTIDLTTTGTGAINESSGTLTAHAVNLSSALADIGSSGSNILTAASTVTANTSGNAYVTNTGDVTLDASSAGSGNTFDLTTTSNGNIALGGNVVAGSGTIGTINITAGGSGSITDPTHLLAATNLNLTSGTGSIGTSSNNILASATNFTGNTSGSGNIYLSNNQSLNIVNANTAGGIYSVKTTSGNINIEANIDPTEIDLSSAGDITDVNGNVVTANIVTLISTGGGNIGTSSHPIMTAASDESANTSGSGNIYVTNTGAVTVNASGSGTGSFNFVNDNAITVGGNISAGTISLISTGSGDSITLNDRLTASGSGNAITIANSGGTFDNTDGSSVFDLTGSGRYLVYSGNPANDALGGLSGFNKHYDITYGNNISAYNSGNYFFYSIAPVLTLTANDTSKSYGGALPLFTGTYSGFIDGDTVSNSGLSGSAIYSTSATSASHVGNYAINTNVSGIASSLGYQFTGASGILSVSPVSLTITAANKNKVQGQVNPTFTASYNGFVLGQNSSVLGGTLNLSSPATTPSPIGNYAIIPSGLTSSDYTLHFVNGTLSVTSAFTPPTSTPMTTTTNIPYLLSPIQTPPTVIPYQYVQQQQAFNSFQNTALYFVSPISSQPWVIDESQILPLEPVANTLTAPGELIVLPNIPLNFSDAAWDKDIALRKPH